MAASYVSAQSAGEVIRNAFQIYVRHFPLLVVYMLLQVPVIFLSDTAESLYLLAYNLIITGPITILLSDICVGNRPSVVRSIRQGLLRRFTGYLLTSLLLFAIYVGGLLLLIVPGVIFILWYQLALVVVVIEGRYGMQALKRSRFLTKGFYMRNLRVVLLLTGIALLIVVMIVVPLTLGGIEAESPLMDQAGKLMGVLFGPLAAIAVILLYYDLRVRKEAYDNAALAEDLRR